MTAGQVTTKSQSLTKWARVRSKSVMSNEMYAVFVGHAQDVLSSLPNGCVDTCVTSPPYWQARDYGHDQQIGLERDLDDYIEKLVGVFREVRRLLVESGTIWLNLGDTYLHGVGTIDGQPPARGWRRNKQLALVPFRVATGLQDDGWWVRNVVVWHKPNAMPSSVRDRLTTTWEPMFLLTKGERYFFNLDSIRVPHETDDRVERVRALRGAANGKANGRGDLRPWLNSPRHRSTIEGLRQIERRPSAPRATELAAYLRKALEAKGHDIEWVARELGLPFERTRHYFRTDVIGSRLPPDEVWSKLKALLELDNSFDRAMTVAIGDNVFRNHPLGRNPGDLWSISIRGSTDSHFATMPLTLADRVLRATLPPGGVCLDPFMGIGTSGVAALNLGGRFVGIDLNQEYVETFLNHSQQIGMFATEA